MTQTMTFDGDETDQSGKVHPIRRATCRLCQAILSEYYHGCCDHASSGFYLTEKHVCLSGDQA
jgi:hypothetical protein